MHFRISLTPKEGVLSTISYVQRNLLPKLQLWDIHVKSFDVLKVKNSDSIPNVTDVTIDVQADCSFPLEEAYRKLTTAWMEITYICQEGEYPILIISDSVAFKKTRLSQHNNIAIQELAFGSTPYSGQYILYESLQLLNCISNFFHDTRSIEVYFFHGTLKHMLKISYSNIRNILVKDVDNKPFELYLDLLHPPLIYRVQYKYSRYFGNYTINHRILNCNVDLSILGKANVLRLCLTNAAEARQVVSRLRYRCGQLPVHYANMKVVLSSPPVMPIIKLPDFPCTYLLTAIFSRNFSVPEQCKYIPSISFFETLGISSNIKPKYIAKALTEILFIIDSGKLFNFNHALKLLCDYYSKIEHENSFDHYIIPTRCRLICRVIITPTRILLWPQEIMSENRVLRNFESEFALRVNFRDDDMSKLSWNALYTSEDIFDSAIRKPMINGLTLGERHYQFLGWSNSQIRDHGVWMYATDSKGRNVEDIRQWMGDFSHIHSVPKYMARMGQSFSQTEATVSVPLNKSHIRTENDIEHGYDSSSRKAYCFSDGIGKISSKLAKEVHEVLGHDKHCSAFQIRYGGYKGMLVEDPTLNETDIVFRNSMKKFDSPKNIRLEIARTSAPGVLQLNRPLITILNQMGVKTPIFLQMQENMLRTLTDMLLDEEKAADFLKSKSPSGIFKYKELSGSGIGLTTEPFFRSLLLALHRHHVEKIKTKANIAIDPDEGRNMLGVLDETGLLAYGEVFVQYTKDILAGETTKDTKILKGQVLVTKNPCAHPGDVRKFTAVDIPELHHIIDCIVFPQKGERPHPNEMAGSDLDGDEYAVIWKPELFFHQMNYAPAHYPSLSSPVNDHIQDKDIIEFLVQYIKNDQVGVIANAHLAHADEEGIFSELCISIAKKFSIAVDFAKSGAPAHLGIHERPKMFPDFMEKNFKKTYKSGRALGKLYRVCKDFESENQTASISYSHVQVDPALIFPGWEKFEQEALISRNKYNRLLNSILQQYAIEHEAEAFSAAFTRLHCRYQERKDRAEVEKVIIACIKTLCQNMKNEFLELEDEEDIEKQQSSILQKASAWYVVTYRDPNTKYLSFPWIVSRYLANIKIRNLCETGKVKSFYAPLVVKLDTIMHESAAANLIPNLSVTAKTFLDQGYFFCDRKIVETSLRVLVLWATEEEIIQEIGYSPKGFLFFKTFLSLFYHVAELECYVSKSNNSQRVGNPNKEAQFSAAALCLAFFRFCVTLRFYNKQEVKKFLPFEVFNYKWLSIKAMITYHSIAVSGIFRVLCFDTVDKLDSTIFEMKPVYIESSVFSNSPVSEAELKKAEDALLKHSGVEDLNMREITTNKKILISARGNETAIHILKKTLRRKFVDLRQLFLTGELNT